MELYPSALGSLMRPRRSSSLPSRGPLPLECQLRATCSAETEYAWSGVAVRGRDHDWHTLVEAATASKALCCDMRCAGLRAARWSESAVVQRTQHTVRATSLFLLACVGCVSHKFTTCQCGSN